MVSFAARSLAGLALLAATTSNSVAADIQCTDVHITFGRGTFQPAGLGSCGTPFVGNLTAALAGKTVSSYAVDYAADALQISAGAGATDLARHVSAVAAACPSTVFVLGGYSQGATLTAIALGVNTALGKGESIPTALAPRITAVVTFGSPLGLLGQSIATGSALYAAKAINYCNKGDPVCGGGLNPRAHLSYKTDSVPEAALRAAALVLAAPSRRNLRHRDAQ